KQQAVERLAGERSRLFDNAADGSLKLEGHCVRVQLVDLETGAFGNGGMIAAARRRVAEPEDFPIARWQRCMQQSAVIHLRCQVDDRFRRNAWLGRTRHTTHWLGGRTDLAFDLVDTFLRARNREYSDVFVEV